jgi:hypothetical protein
VGEEHCFRLPTLLRAYFQDVRWLHILTQLTQEYFHSRELPY